MPQLILYAADLVAIVVLVFGCFLRRHRRPELLVAYLTANVGVLAATAALSYSTVGAGLGLGLLGILSIIRLRSEELSQTEVAYYFAALALGLLGGLDLTQPFLALGLMAALLLAVGIGDHPRVARRPRSQRILLDRAHLSDATLQAHLTELLQATVLSARAIQTDLVNDTTLVEVRYRVTGDGAPGAPTAKAVLK